MKDNLAVAKGIIIALIFGALCWGVLIWGGLYVWKTFIKPMEAKITHIVEIERSSYDYRYLFSK